MVNLKKNLYSQLKLKKKQQKLNISGKFYGKLQQTPQIHGKYLQKYRE